MSKKPFSEKIHDDVKDFFNQIFLEDLQKLHENMSNEIKTLNEKYNKIVTDIEDDYKRANEIKQKFLNAIDPLIDQESSFFKQITEVEIATKAIKPAVDTIASTVKNDLNQITITSGKSLSFAEYAVLMYSTLAKVKEEVSVINNSIRIVFNRSDSGDVSIYGKIGDVSKRINEFSAQCNTMLDNIKSIIELDQRVLVNKDGVVLSFFNEFGRIESNFATLAITVGKINDYLDNNRIMPYDQLKKSLDEVTDNQKKYRIIVLYSILLQFITIISIVLIYLLK